MECEIDTFKNIFYKNSLHESTGSEILSKMPPLIVNTLRRYAIKYLRYLKNKNSKSFETLFTMYKNKNIKGIKDIVQKQIESGSIQFENFNTKKLLLGGMGGVVSLLGAVGMSVKAWMHYTPENLPNITTTEIIGDVFVSLLVLAMPLITGSIVDHYNDQENTEKYINDLENEKQKLADALDALKTKEYIDNVTDLEIEK